MKNHDAFVSYSSRDQEIADRTVTTLEQKEIRCWLASRDIHAGESWAGSILRAIETARVLILLYSADANASPQVLREVERAVAKGLVIVVFRLDDSPMTPVMEYFVSLCQWLKATGETPDENLARLAQIVRQWLPTFQERSKLAMQVRATALYADLQSYTVMAGGPKWELVVRWLHDYVCSFGACIDRYGGTVGHCAGDAIMASFGVPSRSEDSPGVREDAQNAVRCALAMSQELDALDARWAHQLSRPVARMRIGLSHGWMAVSHHEIAGDERANFFGAPVDFAMRLNHASGESVSAGRVSIVIDDRTRALLDHTFQIRGPESVPMRGMETPQQAWFVTGRAAI